MRTCALILSAALWFTPAPAYSQLNDSNGATLKGQIEARVTQGLTVQLYDLTRRTTLTSSTVYMDGRFEIHDAAPGPYLVTVLDQTGEEVYNGNVNVGVLALPLVIRIDERERTRPPSSTISIYQLQHVPSRKALDAAGRAEKLSQAGSFVKAAESLEKAVALSPDYADAHTNLGAQYLRLGRYADSITETERAEALDGPTPLRLCNLGFAELQLHRSAESMEAARKAVQLKSDEPCANYLMGLLLFLKHAPIEEVRARLELAGRTLPAAKDLWEKIAAAGIVVR